jgi:hypothetical protein
VTAPIQLLTIGIDEAQVPEEVVGEFARLQDAGLVQVLDVLFVHHNVDGDVDSVERLDAERMRFDGSLLTALLTADAQEPAASNDAAWSIQDVIPRGQIAALVLVAHLWAEALVTSMLASGGQMFDEFWLSSDDRDVLDALIAARGRPPFVPFEVVFGRMLVEGLTQSSAWGDSRSSHPTRAE